MWRRNTVRCSFTSRGPQGVEGINYQGCVVSEWGFWRFVVLTFNIVHRLSYFYIVHRLSYFYIVHRRSYF
ncbi:unnamed protein product [Chondrus crispus]|uniref:Uncharacterized protein n=1 Tax=Chondrus crispus TaxID=2769 RepID=R7QJH7_CHOCR|nr:unnamed protein product [Chondrus crispus]CDF38254.1 unnamed protein product [Chondrus crispus]|eukprot:XP_005718139.1 unnamed protein product [Chondrus crispus]